MSHDHDDPQLEALVREIIGRVADKWTMLVSDALTEHGRLRFTRLGTLIGGVSQKKLTKTVRQMEADGLVSHTVFPVIPPRVEYELTELGKSLGETFCGVWIWAELATARCHTNSDQPCQGLVKGLSVNTINLPDMPVEGVGKTLIEFAKCRTTWGNIHS